MGTYVIPADELEGPFEAFLLEQEGEVYAKTIAEVWNKLAQKNKWNDNLKAINKYTKKGIK